MGSVKKANMKRLQKLPKMLERLGGFNSILVLFYALFRKNSDPIEK